MRRDEDETVNGIAVPDRSDALEYMTDLILEMEFMARRMGCTALANILRCAHDEAARHSSSKSS